MPTEPPIKRIFKSSMEGGNFTQTPNALLNDKRLSWKAKGIAVYLLGKPEDWILRVTDICNHSNDGPASVRAALDELRECGYVKMEKYREKGKIMDSIWYVSDTPCFSVHPLAPYSDFPHTVFPHTENRHHSNTEVKNTENTKKSKGSVFRSAPKPIPPSEVEVRDFLEENECRGILDKRPDIYDCLIKAGWKDGKGKYIRDWRSFFLAFETTIHDATHGS